MALFKAIKEGWDGRQLRKPGEVFDFAGKKGSWMIPCDENGKLGEGWQEPEEARPVRAGSSTPSGHTREALREQCRALGIQFKAMWGVVDLATAIYAHNNATATAPVVTGTDVI